MKVFLSALLLSLFAVFSPLSHATFANDSCKNLPGIYEYIDNNDKSGSSIEIISVDVGYKMIEKIWEDGKYYPAKLFNINNCKDGHFRARFDGQLYYLDGYINGDQLTISTWGTLTYIRKA